MKWNESCSVMSDSVTPWTVAHQAPLSKGFPRQEYWSGLPFPSPGDLSNPGIKPSFPALQADSLPSVLPYSSTGICDIAESNTILKAICMYAQSCPALCNPVDYTVPGILQARILEWVAVPFSRGSSQPRDQTQVSHIAGNFFTSWATRETQCTQSGG